MEDQDDLPSSEISPAFIPKWNWQAQRKTAQQQCMKDVSPSGRTTQTDNPFICSISVHRDEQQLIHFSRHLFISSTLPKRLINVRCDKFVPPYVHCQLILSGLRYLQKITYDTWHNNQTALNIRVWAELYLQIYPLYPPPPFISERMLYKMLDRFR